MNRNKRLVWHDTEIIEVFDLLLQCKKREDIRKIFDKILTPREINDIGRRYQTLLMLDAKIPYADIRIKTGMSPVTINRLATKCGFGFSKSSGFNKKPRPNARPKTRLSYKGVKVI